MGPEKISTEHNDTWSHKTILRTQNDVEYFFRNRLPTLFYFILHLIVAGRATMVQFRLYFNKREDHRAP